MAKNRSKGQKQKNVFQVANKNAKPKNKTKPVATSLKKIKVGNSDKVDNMNTVFTEVQREVKSISKCTAQEPRRQLQVNPYSFQKIICNTNIFLCPEVLKNIFWPT
ncbi:hypothetical protein EOD39_16167 [Acipenser ruthenus]|uniref:Ribosomal biogenesis factor n=1 Tax=Acipenser ruthenus TaxID=7906 RepID=A0A444V6P1_ACIRT|nr:hypothetical protein EOD39_16167 [Acipenser ruthenus]